ncbi:MAG: hypothetical protein K6T31_10710, partial [Alicyclobacillus sp.]|nr:hypothetical protein [Alicyclobacillus sp.]
MNRVDAGRPVRLGIAGAGAFAAFLAEAFAPMPDVVLTAVAAHTPAKREQTAAAFAQHRPSS